MMRNVVVVISVMVLWACNSEQNPKKLTRFVDPLIGTGVATTPSAIKHGIHGENNAQVVPFVTAPFGMTNWVAQTRNTEKKCLAPYYYTDSLIQGFRASHWLSGSCVQDYGTMTLMPTMGSLVTDPQKRASGFKREKEKAQVASYQVNLERYGIRALMSATTRAGIFEFTYSKEGQAHMLFDVNSDEGQGYVNVIPEAGEIEGYNPVHRIYQGHGEAAGFSGYFVVKIEKTPLGFGVYDQDGVKAGVKTDKNKNGLGAYVSFQVQPEERIKLTVGTSFVSLEEARKNLAGEIGDKGIARIILDLDDQWESLLSQVQVEGKVEADKVKFYTGLYHSYLHPRTFSDLSGTYPAFDGNAQTMTKNSGAYYSDFSMWDTYRASHPLFNLLIPSKNRAMMESLLLMAEQGGWLPIFPVWNSYTSAMIGDHASATISDALSKGTLELNPNQYKYLLKNAFESPQDFSDYKAGKGRRGLKSYLKYGYIPLEDPVNESFHKREQVSRTLEYAFDDYTLYQTALKMGDIENAKRLRKRAANYAHVFSKPDLSVRGRYRDGSFIDSLAINERQFFITEGTPRQYMWYVPHDVAGLIALMGGDNVFNETLDSFREEGHYWHGNEPGHQTPFMYNFSGQAWKTQDWVHEIVSTEYGVGPGGLSGNDDAGQMSAWLVFAQMGFYPVAPSVPQYVISGPKFDKMEIQFENGNQLQILAPGASEGKKYIQAIRWNGKPYTKTYFDHFELLEGGAIVFDMGDMPNMLWGVSKKDRPYSMSGAK
ncbi:GH92 family glycosyl hydrolase [Sediminicola luteus]|nr:GH92 family glycosyl hydrolase [Sediminicola luteus]